MVAQHQSILRPILLKTYYVKGELNDFRFENGKVTSFKFAKGKLTTSQLKWDEERPEHYTAVTRYLFTPKEHGQKTCTECMNPEKYGPFAECVAGPRDGEHQGACLHCVYKGEGEGCSLRVGFQGDPKKARYSGSRVAFLRETIRDIPTEMLLKAREILLAEIRRRRENMENM
ncbi:hypothetical protein QBC32DRAFT_321265 [Pseudoneurospora amorphoporcata]|uniref:Uncharacterized protein n=1 Tax=Pseudoneurospora amorphoporcata TaxID=241081 RepID=A0AAN6SK62_9PEZI|nr:hypothetical protein QBC32DRAFT_321265 [Pseudoneurospora amorphoporcata]